MSFPVAKGRLTNKVIILDIDHTLVSTMRDEEQKIFDSLPYEEQLTHKLLRLSFPIGDEGYVFEAESICRPHLTEFLTWCNIYFSQVIIWTAGTESYANAVVNALYDDRIYPKPLVYGRSSCDLIEGNFYKPIEKLITSKKLQGIVNLQNIMSLQNCVIVDDTPYTYSFNPDNAIPIPPYLRENFSVETLRQSDECLLHIKAWFESSRVRNATDMRDLKDKKAIFNKPLSELRNSPR